jgi:hypothetical protein
MKSGEERSFMPKRNHPMPEARGDFSPSPSGAPDRAAGAA